ncbi:MAG: 2-hydroxyacid dehydrogenase [Immundisolibacter sp.]|uniref:2-hydroxyacid dehydrogenase n=1 Tax=Immundisolibacter sp. TaxID=1934948 RepID=UPI003D0FCBAB
MTTRKPTVLCTMGPELRPLLEAKLTGLADVHFLSEIDAADRRAALAEAQVLFCLRPQMEIGADWPAQPGWRFVQFMSAGVDHIDLARFPNTAKLACNGGGFSEAMAEHILAMALALSKKLLYNHHRMQQGVFDQLSDTGTLRGKTAGIVGFGGIGQATADLLRHFDMRIEAINSRGHSDHPADFIGTLADLERVIRAADLLLISLPLTPQSAGLIGAWELGWLKPDAMLINVARGEIIDEKALYDWLVANPNGCAGIDAWWIEPFRHGEFRMNYPFLDLPNVLGSPHNSPRTPGGAQVSAARACENIARWLRGEMPHGLLDAASVNMA